MTAATLNDVEIRRALVGSFHAGLERCQPYALTARIYRRNVRRSSSPRARPRTPCCRRPRTPTRDRRGGRNALWAIACDTDGIDGTTDSTGAIITPHTLQRATALGLDTRDHLARNDAYTIFAKLDDLVTTGPARQNLNDYRAIVIA